MSRGNTLMVLPFFPKLNLPKNFAVYRLALSKRCLRVFVIGFTVVEDVVVQTLGCGWSGGPTGGPCGLGGKLNDVGDVGCRFLGRTEKEGPAKESSLFSCPPKNPHFCIW